MALFCAFQQGLFRGALIRRLSLTAMLRLLQLFFLLSQFFPPLPLTLLTPLPQIQIFQRNRGPGLQLKNILLDLGQLFLVLNSDIVEYMVDKFAQMDSLAFDYVMEVLFPARELQPQTAVLVEERVAGLGYGGVQHLNQSGTQSQNLSNIQRHLLGIGGDMGHKQGFSDRGIALLLKPPQNLFLLRKDLLLLQFYCGEELREQGQLLVVGRGRLDVLCDEVQQLQVELLAALYDLDERRDSLQLVLRGLFHLLFYKGQDFIYLSSPQSYLFRSSDSCSSFQSFYLSGDILIDKYEVYNFQSEQQMKQFKRKRKSLWLFLLWMFSLVAPIDCTNFQFRPQKHHFPTPQLIPAIPKHILQPTDQSSLIYNTFIQTLLGNQQFTQSLIQSVSNVFYNHWVVNLSKLLQKKYLKILLTTGRNDESTEMTSEQNFELLRKILEDSEMAKEFLKYLDFDFDKKEFGEFVRRYLKEYGKGMEVGGLGDSDKAKIYLMALEKEEELEEGEGKVGKDDKEKEKPKKFENTEGPQKLQQKKIQQKEK